MKIMIAVFLSILSIFVFNAAPAGWFRDYDEPERLGRKRISMLPAPVLLLCFYMAEDLPICFFLVQLAIADGCYYILPDQWICAIASCGVLNLAAPGCAAPGAGAAGILSAAGPAADRLIAAAGPLLLWFAAAALAAIPGKPPAFGFGDAKLFSALGLALGASPSLQIFAAACLTAGAATPLFLLFKEKQLPFAPFVLIGYIIICQLALFIGAN